MRKSTIQLLILLLAGGIIFWREWASNFVISTSLDKGLETNIPPSWINASPNSIIWLILVAGGLLLMTELLTKYLKLSSPNSV